MKEETEEEIDTLISTITSLLSCYSKTNNLEVADEITKRLEALENHSKINRKEYKDTYVCLKKHWFNLSTKQ